MCHTALLSTGSSSNKFQRMIENRKVRNPKYWVCPIDHWEVFSHHKGRHIDRYHDGLVERRCIDENENIATDVSIYERETGVAPGENLTGYLRDAGLQDTAVYTDLKQFVPRIEMPFG